MLLIEKQKRSYNPLEPFLMLLIWTFRKSNTIDAIDDCHSIHTQIKCTKGNDVASANMER